MLLAGLSQLQVAETLVNEHVGLTLGRRSRESCQVASSDLRTAFRRELPKPRPPRSSALKLRRLLAVSPRWVLCHSAHPQRWMRRFAPSGGREGAKPKPVMGWYPADADQIPTSIHHVPTSVSYFSPSFIQTYIFSNPKPLPDRQQAVCRDVSGCQIPQLSGPLQSPDSRSSSRHMPGRR